MNIEHLKLFVRVAALKNISKAGRELGLSAAVSSAHMTQLEESLGVRLVHRTTRKVSLTEEGQAFLPHARDLLEQVELARASVGVGSVKPSGRLRVTAPASFGRMHLIPALDAFMTQYPDLRVDLHLSDTIVDMVEGGFDVSIRDASLQDSSLVAKKLAPVHRVVCASPAYLKRAGTPEKPEDLLSHQCVTLMGLETWTFRTPEGLNSIRTSNRLRADNGEAVRDAAVCGLGITISSLWCCYQQLISGELVPILEDYPLDSQTDIWALFPSSRLLAPKIRVFLDYLADYFGETPYWQRALDEAALSIAQPKSRGR